MDAIKNRFKAGMREGKVQLGCWLSLCSPLASEIVAGAGFDWLLIDTEHAANEPPDVLRQLHAVAAGGNSLPVVRVAWNDMILMKRLLDLGVHSFLVPMVSNAEEARQAVAHTRYPPHGVRGAASSTRANRWSRIKDYFPRAHEDICLLVQIETRAGLDNIEKIAAVDGVDGLFIGPMDLATSLGYLGNPGQAEVRTAITDAIKRIRATGKAAGILAPVEADAKHWLEQGSTVVAVASDLGILARQSEAIVARFKG